MRNFHRMISILFAFVFVACGQPFQSQGTNGPSTKGTGTPNTPPPTTGNTWSQIQIKGLISGGTHDQSLALDLDKERKVLIIHLPIIANPLLFMSKGDIPEIPGAQFSLISRNSETWDFAVEIPIEQLIRPASLSSPKRLPNGNPLPGIPGGELPSASLKLSGPSQTQAQLYLGVQMVALFVGTPFPLGLDFTFPIKNEGNRKILGYFSAIREKNQHQGGFFISGLLPDDLARQIDELL